MKNKKDWRSKFLEACGPGLLSGVRFEDWAQLLRQSGVTVDARYFPKLISITMQSLKASLVGRAELRKYAKVLSEVVLRPPLFVLGHWRSGTTHLHQMIAQDPRFGFPNTYQVSFPHTFLSTEAVDSRWLSFFIPRCRPMDNVEITLSSPQEDEFALCAATLKSPCLAWVFPEQKEKFEKYLTFRNVEPTEVAEWRGALLLFLKKVQWRCGRPLVLKSPPHTSRVRLLLELFPDAKFVHIHRDPFVVFQSSRLAFQTMFKWHGLQRSTSDNLDDWILRQYREMYDAFFADKLLIPPGRFHEIAFEQLEQDPIGEMRKAYEALDLPAFDTFEPRLQAYINSLSGYVKNSLPKVSPDLKARIAGTWNRCFEEWATPFRQRKRPS